MIQRLYPIGIQPDDIDPVWVSTIEGFRTKRGETAYTASRTQQAIDPADELQVISYLLSELQTIDIKIGKLI